MSRRYRSVSKYMKKNRIKKERKHFVYNFFVKLFLVLIIILIGFIFIKGNDELTLKINRYLSKYDFNVSRINNWYKQHFGDIIPFQNIVGDKTKFVFSENLSYSGYKKYKDGICLNVEEKYLVPILESGIVVFAGDKDYYGKTVIIEQIDGVSVWYGGVSNLNVSLYDYVSKGEYLGEANKKLYLAFEKKGKFIDYKKYLK